jgi:Flp pilus assembly protein TadD
VASREIHFDASASLDRWSGLDFQELLAEARSTFAAGALDVVHDLCLVGLTRFPNSAPLLTILGWVYAELSDFSQAEATFRHALCQDAASVDTQAGLAAVLAAKGEFAAAVPHYEQALALHAHDAQTLFNFGSTLLSLRRFDEAIAAFEDALQLDPTQDEVFHNLAIAHAQGGRWQAAGEFCERALAIRPDAWRARLMRGMTRIALGSFADGWDDYEARGLGHDGESERFGLPTWEGPGDAKRSIAVVPEQGVGTQILFASCVADLAARVPNVTLGCEPRLVGLLRRSLPAVHVVAGSLLPMLAKCDLFDCQIKAGSLPRVFRRSADAFPGVRYLAADPGLKTGWQARLDSLGPGLKVGVSWGGGARKSDASHRHTDPTAWRRLAEVAGVHWINLQYDTLAEERAAWQRIAGERFHDWNDFDKKFDLENLVALVSELDLVITVVNSNVHFAGAVGTPTWALIPRGGEWRWQAAGEKCVWHDSVRLFRQERLEDWSGVFAEIEVALRALAPRTAEGGQRGRAA